MKSYYLVLISVIIISCNSQKQRNTSDSAGNDSAITAPETDSREMSSIVYCPELVKEILKSSPRYKQLTDGLLQAVKKNGGTSVDIILDKSPDPKKEKAMDSSVNYEMLVTENYPDRQVNIAHFTFNPANNKLYEYDVVRDQLITVEFDNNLIDNAGQYCK